MDTWLSYELIEQILKLIDGVDELENFRAHLVDMRDNGEGVDGQVQITVLDDEVQVLCANLAEVHDLYNFVQELQCEE